MLAKNSYRQKPLTSMKFGKEFGSQLVQEWQGAYMDYNHLKKQLKIVHSSGFPKRKPTLYRAFSGLSSRSSPKMKEEEVIKVPYQTLLLRLSEEGAEHELMFFNTLDCEFDKVRLFHETKVQEMKVNAEKLSKQMGALIALRIGLDKPTDADAVNVVSSDTRTPVAVSSAHSGERGGMHMDVIQEVDKSGEDDLREKNGGESFRPAPLQVLDNVKINVDPETPVSTITSSKVELRKPEKKLRKAFVEFHGQLRLLKSFSFLNMLAFSKIMKKYDKITSRNASKTYLQILDMSSLGSSDEVNKLTLKVEAEFIKHFANGNRREGMKFLRPGRKIERHRTTFFLGLFTGCCVALIAGIIVSVHARNLLEHHGGVQYMTNIFPLYSFFGYLLLHMAMYGTNTYLWRRLRVNYPFIFGCKQETSLGFREVLLLASGLSVLTMAAVLFHLDFQMDPETERFRLLTEVLPLGLVTIVLLITFCPFNIICRSSRFFLIRSAWRCICAPLYKVTFIDFFLADQLTSQIQAIRSLQFYVCYYVWGDFRARSNKCTESVTYKSLYIAVAVIPFWMRLLQCLRRVFEEKNTMQGLNALKYFLTVVALVLRSLYDITRQNGTPSMLWRIMAAATSGITTIYNTYWDIVVDWGLLQKNSKNKWLRDKLLISNKAVYVLAIVLNILLRLVWMQLVLDFNLPFLHRNAMIAVVASLEILVVVFGTSLGWRTSTLATWRIIEHSSLYLCHSTINKPRLYSTSLRLEAYEARSLNLMPVFQEILF